MTSRNHGSFSNDFPGFSFSDMLLDYTQNRDLPRTPFTAKHTRETDQRFGIPTSNVARIGQVADSIAETLSSHTDLAKLDST